MKKLLKSVTERKKNSMFGLFFTFITSVLCSFAALSSAPLDNAANEQVDKPIQEMAYYDEYGYQLYMTLGDLQSDDFFFTFISEVSGVVGSENYNLSYNVPNVQIYNLTLSYSGYYPLLCTLSNDGSVNVNDSPGWGYKVTSIAITKLLLSSALNPDTDITSYRYQYQINFNFIAGINYYINYYIQIDLSDNGRELNGRWNLLGTSSTFPLNITSNNLYWVYYENDLNGFSPLITYYLRPKLEAMAGTYIAGYQEGELDGYRSGYGVGKQDGYQEGYSHGEIDGYASGYPQGVLDGQSQDETAVAIFSGILNIALVPINFFLAVLNFEVFGINIGAFVSALLTIAIVVIIIRMILGGKSDDK